MKRSIIRFDDWSFDRESGELTGSRGATRLPELQRQVLDALLERAGSLVTRDELVARLWPKGVVLDFDTGLNAAIRKVRLALGDDAERPRYIETIPKRGYRFIGAIEPLPETPAPQRVTIPVKRHAVRSRIGLGLAFAVLALLAYRLIWMTAPPAESGQVPVRLAVLPFENLSPDPAHAFFADGMHEEVMNTLAARASNLQVISRTTMLTYAAPRRSTPDIRRELEATHVLEGAVRRDGQDIRISLQLIDANTDATVWSQTYDGTLENALMVQSQVAKDVSRQLAVKLSTPLARRLSVVRADSYDLYLKAKLAARRINVMTTASAYRAMDQDITRAIELDPTFADAYIVRGEVRLRSFASGVDPIEAHLAEVRADIAAARRIAGDTPELLSLESQIAIYVEGDRRKAAELMALAEIVGPLNAEQLLRQGVAAAALDRWAEADAIFTRSRRLDPANPQGWNLALSNLWVARRPVEAMRLAREYDLRYPGQLRYGHLVRAYTGQLDRWRLEQSAYRSHAPPETQLATDFALLRAERRFDELAQLLATTRTTRMKEMFVGGFSPYGLGYAPLAAARGWSRLLSGETNARADGEAVLRYVEAQQRTPMNDWYLSVLTGEGELFVSNKARAIELARDALSKTSASGRMIRRAAKAHAARIFAWAGAHDDALALLEELTSGYPGIGPAEVVQDPIFYQPLIDNARYARLAERLEREIEANLKEVEPLLVGLSAPRPGT